MADALAITDGIKPNLPVVEIERITSDGTPITLLELEQRHGNVTLLELIVLSRLVRERAPRSLFEIGTFDGRTTLNLAANAPDDAVVHTLDLPPNRPTAYALSPADYQFVNKPASGARITAGACAERVRQLYGDSATFDFTPYKADFVFVDGSHAYEYVLSDSMRALALIGEGPAVIAWHDYGVWDGVTRGLEELASTDPRFQNLQWVRGTSLVVMVR
ncbi:MAG TPA: class I SAM-dependent methyltransferase [Tepidisphaeraceae bacterium]|nr:class I SAM-dependent methyltransferase [Tepidisphaeraceae bacterium]